MVKRIIIDPSCPLRSALVQLMSRPRCRWVGLGELAGVAGVGIPRALAYVTVLTHSGEVMLDPPKRRIYKTTKWDLFVEETNGGSLTYRQRTGTCLTKEQRQKLKELRRDAARAFGRKVQQARQSLGLSKAQLAAEAGVSFLMVRKTLEGEQLPPAFVVLQLCAALGLDLTADMAKIGEAVTEVMLDPKSLDL